MLRYLAGLNMFNICGAKSPFYKFINTIESYTRFQGLFSTLKFLCCRKWPFTLGSKFPQGVFLLSDYPREVEKPFFTTLERKKVAIFNTVMSKYWTNPVFKWSEDVWLSNGPK